MQQHPVIHVLLQTHSPIPAEMLQPPGWKPVNEDDSDEDPMYEVQHILDSRSSGENEKLLVQWEGFPASAATWESLSHLDGCMDVLRTFHASKTGRRKKNAI